MAERNDSWESRHSSILDGFTVITGCLDSNVEAMKLSRSQYDQVIFRDIKEVYNPEADIECLYFYSTEHSTPQPEDIIAIFKANWVSVNEFTTSVPASLVKNDDNSYSVTFKGSLPNEGSELFQFCYLTAGKIIAGVSTPFSFERLYRYNVVEDPTDPGLLVLEKKTPDKISPIWQFLLDKNDFIEKALHKEVLAREELEIKLMDADTNFGVFFKEIYSIIYSNDLKEELKKYGEEVIKNKILRELKKKVRDSAPNSAADLTVGSILEAMNNMMVSIEELKKSAINKNNLETSMLQFIQGNVKGSPFPTNKNSEQNSLEITTGISSDDNSEVLTSMHGSHVRRTGSLLEIKEDKETLKAKLQEVNELLAFTQSRVAVLELELSSAQAMTEVKTTSVGTTNTCEVSLLLKVVKELNTQNEKLKRELDMSSKLNCLKETELLKLKKFTEENKLPFKFKEPSEENMTSSLLMMEKKLMEAQKANSHLQHMLTAMQKETVGKISLNILNSNNQ